MKKAPGFTFNQASPSIRINDKSTTDKHDTPFDSPFELNFDDHFEDFQNASAGDMAGGRSPFIKSEPNDFFFGGNTNDDFGVNENDLHGIGNHIDPSQLAQNSNLAHSFNNNLSSSYVAGNSGIGDDELADLAGSLDTDRFASGQHMTSDFFNHNSTSGSMPMAMPQHGNSGLFPSTSEGLPTQSPFVQNDGYNNFNQFRPSSAHQGSQPVGMPSFQNSVMRSGHYNNMDRRVSDAILAASPGATSAIRGLHIGETADYTSSNNIQRTMMQHRHSASLSNNWEGGQSWGDVSHVGTPLTAKPIRQAQPTDLRSPGIGNIASSLPVKIESGMSAAPFQTQEAKKRRRRECHNIVERRRRDNINERIHDLGTLVPQHRLEDDKVKKHLQTNNPLSPMVATSASPPAVSSSLPNGIIRRSSAISAMALPSEDKDKGPNKGDILNSSVAWTRDVIWFMKMKIEQEQQLERLIQQLGGTWPFEKSDDEIRMRSELHEVIQRNSLNNNIRPYSRASGSGLRVPGFTNLAGDTLQPGEGVSSNSSISPVFAGAASSSRSWQYPIDSGLKEEDEDFDDDIMM